MNFEKATDNQLKVIINEDKYIPADLLCECVLEMIKRNLFEGIIVYAVKKVFNKATYTVEIILNMDWKEIIHVGTIEIYNQSKKFKQGMRTPKSFFIMCLISRFIKMKRDANAEKRLANNNTSDIFKLEDKDDVLISPTNIEKHVMNKMLIDECWQYITEREKKAILLEQYGYSQYEIAEMMGFGKTYGNLLINRAYKKIRKGMSA